MQYTLTPWPSFTRRHHLSGTRTLYACLKWTQVGHACLQWGKHTFPCIRYKAACTDAVCWWMPKKLLRFCCFTALPHCYVVLLTATKAAAGDTCATRLIQLPLLTALPTYFSHGRLAVDDDSIEHDHRSAVLLHHQVPSLSGITKTPKCTDMSIAAVLRARYASPASLQLLLQLLGWCEGTCSGGAHDC